jgi:hypothetical protein
MFFFSRPESVMCVHLEGPASGHVDRSFLGVSLSLGKCWDGSSFQVATAAILRQSPPPEDFGFFKIKPRLL